MSATRKVSTLKRYLSSISVRHTLNNLVFDRRHRDIRTILRGIGREAAPARRVKPLMSAQVRRFLEEMGDTLPDLRDAALLALGVASGRRRSELVGLDWMTRGDGAGVFEVVEDGAAIHLHRSKTQADGEVQTYYIKPGLALASVKRWAAAAAIAPGTAVFRAINNKSTIDGGRLNARTVARVVKARCAAAGLDPQEFSGHSLRAGMITSAAEADVPEWRIKQHSGHKSDVIKGYIRPVEKKKHSPTSEIGL
jgi:integrase